ncbi:sigma-E factor negative regulatory protein [Alkalilimnicola sp. S0819]|uniref:sigma-E factor negative regulatory protein n=1 Tax=Alkalilimnicola sp. S0819 TaxID=2613922 RepID=UPI0012617C0F|nr:sigma-E factor negative regulatory protein [Alkalilimnicola sp. S0819]KAB7627553.1 sigma-E factor negative regulatory protein [Alkalilimnicola sp. S0819]MPQ15709.1 hypothetical protein [Alkalilimnicola sp. S0819]
MKDELKEQLSALVDDELRREERAFLLRSLERQAGSAELIGRYCLAREAMSGELPAAESWTLASRVTAALETEAVYRSSLWARVGKRALRPVAGLAVAASVATVSVLVWFDGSTAPGQEALMASRQVTPALTGMRGGNPNIQPVARGSLSQGQAAAFARGGTLDESRWERLDPSVKQRLNVYLVNHGEHASSGGVGSVLTYARIAGHGRED